MFLDNSDTNLYPPIQRRSKATLDAILAATEDLLQEQNFEDITVQQIATRAKVSTGTLYTRFKGKNALLPFLMLRFQHKILRELEDYINDEEKVGWNLERRIQGLCRFLRLHAEGHMRMYYTLLRRRILESNRPGAEDLPPARETRRGDHPAHSPFSTENRDQNHEGELKSRFSALIANWLRSNTREVNHPNPEIAIRMATHLGVQFFLQELVFDSAQHVASPVILEGELNRLLKSYLIG